MILNILTCAFLATTQTTNAATNAAATDATTQPATQPTVLPATQSAPTDSVRTIYVSSETQPLQLELIPVQARRIVRESGADRVELGSSLVESRDGGSVADLATLLPSTHLTVNSRGEALFMVRGSSERHLRVELDGIPLTLPWDERADLSLLPLAAVGKVVARRGVSSALDPVNGLAGLVSMSTLSRELDGSQTRAGLSGGSAGAWTTQLTHLERRGAWESLFAIESRRRDAFLLPADFRAEFNQDPARRARSNSSFEQTAAITRLARDLGEDARMSALLQLSDGSKEVPAETHVSDARFWKIPRVQRALLGVSADLGLDSGRWRLRSVGSVDLHRQDIDAFDDPSYSTRTDFEEDRDRTLFGRVAVDHRIHERLSLTLQGSVRDARHVERTAAVPTDTEFVQRLGQVGAELRFEPRRNWRLRGGIAYEIAATPKSGDKPDRDADDEVSVHGALETDFGSGGKAYLTASRRPRFASLRELFSGALQRFEVNPALEPEVQTTMETGFSWQGRGWNASLGAFAQQLDGAIERIRLSNGKRQRVNLDEVRNLGIEAGLAWAVVRGLSVDLQGTLLRSRARDAAGDFEDPVEDRPDYLLSAAATYTHPSGWQLRNELVGVGPRASLDDASTNPAWPYRSLEADLRWNLRLSYSLFGVDAWYDRSEWFLRLDNVLDELTFSQTGLPESGRTLRLGWNVELAR